MHLIYDAVLLPVRAVAAVRAAWPGSSPATRSEWAERRARAFPRSRAGAVWIHGASLGEARLVEAVAGALRRERPDVPVVGSAVTRTGFDRLPRPPQVDARFFLPLDVGAFQRRLVAALRPAMLVLIETEIWPNLLREASAAGIPYCIVNARLSRERMGRYRALRALYAPLLARLAAVLAQSPDDAARFREIGVPDRVLSVVGNLKYDLPAPPLERHALRARWGVPADRPVLVAGSTAEGEDGPVLDAFVAARASVPGLLLVLAPRHPERFVRAEREAMTRDLRVHRFSAAQGPDLAGADVLLVDALGHLAGLYVLGDAAFVGGSLVPVGGHNVLEPAAAGLPVLFGPHTHHVEEPVDELLRAGGAKRVADSRELAAAWIRLARDPGERARMGDAARHVLERHRGALERTVASILSVLDGEVARDRSIS